MPKRAQMGRLEIEFLFETVEKKVKMGADIDKYIGRGREV